MAAEKQILNLESKGEVINWYIEVTRNGATYWGGFQVDLLDRDSTSILEDTNDKERGELGR